MDHDSNNPPKRRDRVIPAMCAIVGAAAVAVIWFQLRDVVLNVVTYRWVSPPLAGAVATWILPGVVVIGVIAPAIRLMVGNSTKASLNRASCGFIAVASMALTILAIAILGGWTPGFWTIAATCALTTVLVERLVTAPSSTITTMRVATNRRCLAALVVAIIIATAWHAWMQREFWRHFMLGYADFGLYTRELEYCLFYNDVADRWANTRMAYHFEPLFYLLAPAYALFRSPVFLMIIGPLALNSAALAFYWLITRRTGSSVMGLTAGIVWLALPSISRMPYANTYGFESVYLAVPLLAFCFVTAHLSRWRTSHVLLVLAVLCQETIVAVAVGWGVYIALCQGRKRDGIVIVIAAIAYLAVCAGVIIPAISPDDAYVRSEMLGDVATLEFTSRLSREAYWALLFALTAPLLPAIVRKPRMLIAAAPTILLLGLIQNTEYLSIKFWHQSSVLPVVFTCACLGATRRFILPTGETTAAVTTPITSNPNGAVIGMLAGVLLLHQVMGYSPLAQSWNAQRAGATLQTPDSRMETINRLRQEYPPTQTRAAATERIAAHLTDYRAFTTIESIADDTDLSAFDVIIIDYTDTWDPIVRSGAIHPLVTTLQSAGYEPSRLGDIRVFTSKTQDNDR